MDENKLNSMKESLYQQFLLLAEASNKCEDDNLSEITSSMIEIYLLLSASNFSKVL